MLVRLSLNAHDQYELQPVLVQWQGDVPVLVQWQRAVQPWSTLLLLCCAQPEAQLVSPIIAPRIGS